MRHLIKLRGQQPPKDAKSETTFEKNKTLAREQNYNSEAIIEICATDARMQGQSRRN